MANGSGEWAGGEGGEWQREPLSRAASWQLPLYLPTRATKKAKTLLTCDHFYFTSLSSFFVLYLRRSKTRSSSADETKRRPETANGNGQWEWD